MGKSSEDCFAKFLFCIGCCVLFARCIRRFLFGGNTSWVFFMVLYLTPFIFYRWSNRQIKEDNSKNNTYAITNEVPNQQTHNTNFSDGPSTSRPIDTLSAEKDMTYAAPEDLLTYVTGSSWGRWRLSIMLIFCVIMMFHGLNMFMSELLLPEHINFTCIQNKSSNGTNSCYTDNGTECRKFNYSVPYGYTLTEKWNLVCSKHKKIQTCNILFNCTLAIGFIVVGYLADGWGRKRILFIWLCLQPCMGILVTTTGTLPSFMVTRFLHGLSSSTALVVILLVCEISSNKWRTFNLGLLYLSIEIGHTLLPYAWMICADAMKNLLLISIPHIILILFIGILRESPNWWLCKNKTNKAEQVLVAVLNFDRMKVPSTFRIRPVQITNVGSVRSIPLFSMLLPSTTLILVIAMCVLLSLPSLMCGLVFAHILEENHNLMTVLTLFGVTGILAASASTGLCYVMRHKIVIAFCSVIGCFVATISYTLIQAPEPPANFDLQEYSLQIVAYGFFMVAYYSALNAIPCIFPTEMRGQGTGLAIALGKICFLTGRIVFRRVYIHQPTFLAVFCCSTFIILLCCMVIYSVRGRELPDLLEDTINFRDTHKPTRWSTIRAASPTVDETEVKITDFEQGTSEVVQHSSMTFAPPKKRHMKTSGTKQKSATTTTSATA